jgi:hypothetical protein
MAMNFDVVLSGKTGISDLRRILWQERKGSRAPGNVARRAFVLRQ